MCADVKIGWAMRGVVGLPANERERGSSSRKASL